MANMVNATLFTLPPPTCFLACMFAIHEPFQYLHICYIFASSKFVQIHFFVQC